MPGTKDKQEKAGWLAPLAAVLLISSCLTAVGAPASGKTTMDVQCKIRSDENGGWFRLAGVASADKPTTGHYRFRVRKQSASGSSENMQSGTFSLEPGRETVVTTVYLDLGARNGYSAELVLDWDEGTRKCTAP